MERIAPLDRQNAMWEQAMALVSQGIELQSKNSMIRANECLESAVAIMESALMDIKYSPEEREFAQRLNKKMSRYIKMIRSQQQKDVSIQPSNASKGKVKKYNFVDWEDPHPFLLAVIYALEKSSLCGDIMDTLVQLFGFQEQNCLNQKEHIVLLVTNFKMQLEPPQYDGQTLDRAIEENNLKQAIGNLHSRLFVNYTKWAKYVGQKPMFSQERLVDIALFFLIWGEAGNFRQMPEYLCYMFHKLGATARNTLGRGFEPVPQGSFLDKIIRPLYVEFERENNKKTKFGARAEHVVIRNYDDFNEFFWTKKCLKYEPSNVYSAFTPGKDGKPKLAKKTFKESRSWFRALRSYWRIVFFNCALFVACIGFSINMTAFCPTANILYSLQNPPIGANLKFFGQDFVSPDSSKKVPTSQTPTTSGGCSIPLLLICLGSQNKTMLDYPPKDFGELNNQVDFGRRSSSEGCVTTSFGRCSCYRNKLERCFEVQFTATKLDTKTNKIMDSTVDQSVCYPEWKRQALEVIAGKGPGKLNCRTCELSYRNFQGFYALPINFITENLKQPQNLLPLAGGLSFLVVLIVMESYRCMCSRVGLGFVGRSLPVPMGVWIRYSCFWIILYTFKMVTSYQLMIKPLVEASVFIVNYPRSIATEYYHFFMPFDYFHFDYLLAMWLPSWLVFMYDVAIYYSLFSVVVGGFRGFNLRIGEVRSFRILRQTFKSIPDMFNKKVVPNVQNRNDKKKKKQASKKKGKGNPWADIDAPVRKFERISFSHGNKPLIVETQKYTALLGGAGVDKNNPNMPNRGNMTGLSGPAFERTIAFAMAWNRTLETLRESDVICDRELNVLSYLIDAKDANQDRHIYTPPFLTAGKLDEVIDIVTECATMTERMDAKKTKQIQKIESTMLERLTKDDLRMEAILSTYKFTSRVICLLLGREHQEINEMFAFVEEQAYNKKILVALHLNAISKLKSVCSDLMKSILEVPVNTPESSKKFQRSVYTVIDNMENVMNALKTLMKKQEGFVRMLNDTPLKPNSFFFPSAEQQYAAQQLQAIVNNKAARDVVGRAYYLLSVDNLDAEPRSEEGRRRLRFFVNSLFMEMPLARPIRQIPSLSIATPYFSEIVMYTIKDLTEENDEGMKLLFYLATIYPQEWANFLERVGASDANSAVKKNPEEVRLWASYRGQTLARTVRGMMYNEQAIRFLHWLEIGEDDAMHMPGCNCNKCLKLNEMVTMKFGYVCTCQIYGKMKDEQKQQAQDIDYLLLLYPNLRVAYVDGPKRVKEGLPKYYSVLIRNMQGRVVEVYRIELPGNPILGEGKPENHNHAVIFHRGEMLQVIDMNQDGYFEEALKLPNLLLTMERSTKKYPIYVIGLREHIFTGGVSNLASFMGIQELSFVSLGQRVLAMFMVRMHYGHPDILDKFFLITTGGTAKASKGINLSEDIFAGFNATLRGGRVIHEEFIQVGKGRDVGMQQLTLFEAKLSSGAGEAVLSRDVARLGNRLDFFRVQSFFHGNLGWYLIQAVTMFSIYSFIYGKLYQALSGKGELFLQQGGLSIAGVLNTSWALQMGFLLVIPIISVVGVESGFRNGFSYLLSNILTLGPIYFAFHMGTKSHYFDRTLIHGGAKYRATGRGFTIKHEKFAELYRFYSASHFNRGVELIFLLMLFYAYGTFSWCNCSWLVDREFFGNQEPSQFDWNKRCFESLFQQCVLPTQQSYTMITFSLWIVAATFLWAPFFFNPSGLDWNKCIADLADWQDWLKVQNETSQSWLGWWTEENAFYEHSSKMGRFVTIFRSMRFMGLGYLLYLNMMYRNLYKSAGKEIVNIYDLKVIIYSSSFFVLIAILFGIGYFFARVAKKWTLKQRKLRKLKVTVAFFGMIIVVALLAIGLDVASIVELVMIALLTTYSLQMYFIVKGHTGHITVRAIGIFYDRICGWIIFGPILFVAMFLPFISDFQKRIMFNPAFTAGLEVGKLLANEETGTNKVKAKKEKKSK